MKIIAVSLAVLVWSTNALAQTSQHNSPPVLNYPGHGPVWVNTRSVLYHYQGERYYGSTKEGKLMIRRLAFRPIRYLKDDKWHTPRRRHDDICQVVISHAGPQIRRQKERLVAIFGNVARHVISLAAHRQFKHRRWHL